MKGSSAPPRRIPVTSPGEVASGAGRKAATWLLLLACVAVAGLLRVPYMAGPHSADEAAYVTVAREIANGRPPLAQVWFNRSPALYYWYAVADLLPFGIDAGLQLVTLAAWVGGAWILYAILVTSCSAPWPQLGALLYAALSVDRSLQGETANTEPLLNLLLLASLWLLTRWRQSRRTRELFGAGLLAALAVLVKEQVVFFLPIVPLAYFAGESRFGVTAWLRFVAGAGTAILGMIVVAGSRSILDEWWQVLRFHLGYSALPWKNLAAGPLLLATDRPWALFGTWPLWFLAIVFLGDRESWERPLVAARLYLLAAVAMVLSTGHYFAHYLTLALPPLLLSTVPCLARLARDLSTRRLAWALAAAVTAFVTTVQVLATFDRVPLEVRRLTPLGEQSEAVRECARRIASVSREGERLLVYGWEPGFYLYSALQPAAPDLWGYSFGAETNPESAVGWLASRSEDALTKRPPDWLVLAGAPQRGVVWRALEPEVTGGRLIASPLCDDLETLAGYDLRRMRRLGRDSADEPNP